MQKKETERDAVFKPNQHKTTILKPQNRFLVFLLSDNCRLFQSTMVPALSVNKSNKTECQLLLDERKWDAGMAQTSLARQRREQYYHFLHIVLQRSHGCFRLVEEFPGAKHNRSFSR